MRAEVRHCRRRIARQDDDHLAGRVRARRGAGSIRPFVVGGQLMASDATRASAPAISGRRGRRERRVVPAACSVIAVVTNIDAEHLDHYGTHQKVKDAFVEFAARVPFYGLAVLCLDHPHVQDIIPKVPRRHVTYGVSPQSDYSARGIQFRGLTTSFSAYRRASRSADSP